MLARFITLISALHFTLFPVSGHPSGWLGDGASGHMALADSLLGLTPPTDDDPSDPSEPTDWRIDLASYGVTAELPTGAGFEYLSEVSARPDTTLQPIILLDYAHTEIDRQISPAAMALLSIAVGQWVGGLNIIQGIESAFWQGFAKAGLSSVITQTAAGVVSGDFDVGQILEGAVFSGLSAGLTSSINLSFAEGNPFNNALIAKLGSDQFTMSGILNSGLDGVISSGLSSSVYGTDFNDGVLAGLVSYAADGIAGAAIEEVADEFGHYSFDIEKLVAKATINCLAAEAKGADCASGAVGSLVTDFLSHYSATSGNTLGAVDLEDYRDRVGLIAAAAGFFASSGEAANISSTVAGALTDYDNNCGPCAYIPIIIIGLLTAGDYALTASDAYSLTQEGLACDGGDLAACDRAAEMAQQYALEAGITMTVGTVVPGDKIGMKVISLLKRHGDKDVVKAVEDAVDDYNGGPHRDTSKPTNDGLDSHHCPAKKCYEGAPISSADGPAIQMDPADHQMTTSYGKRPEAIEYRAQQQQLLEEGRLMEAIQMDIDDIRRIEIEIGQPGKYDQAVQEMLDYAKTLDPNDFMTP